MALNRDDLSTLATRDQDIEPAEANPNDNPESDAALCQSIAICLCAGHDPMTSNPLEQLRRALEQGLIDRVTYDAAVAGIQAQLDGGGAIAQGTHALAVGAGGVGVGNDVLGDLNTGRQVTAAEGAQIIYAEQGATIVVRDAPVWMKAIDRHSAD